MVLIFTDRRSVSQQAALKTAFWQYIRETLQIQTRYQEISLVCLIKNRPSGLLMVITGTAHAPLLNAGDGAFI